jgi:CubicO group peptidase (beta-lactamase class C family)
MHATLNIAIAACLITATAHAQPSWDEVEQIVQQEVDAGFSGAVLLVHDGEVVLDKGYGLADRAREIPNTPDTIFALGSTPIDITHVAILQLLHQGKLRLDDPITAYFDQIEGEHGAITIDMLRTGRSGLPDFPNIPGIDEDPDHSPLSREELIERTAAAELLFKPGSGEAHSHFAWGVLAAIVEVVSGQTYPEYILEHVLRPADMTRTGFHGDRFPGETVAIGYGAHTWGTINSPEHWGETSWLVMGSGGMVGTTGDLHKFTQAIEDGTLIPARVRHHFPRDSVTLNGNRYGFQTAYNTGIENLFFINCNSADIMNGYSIAEFARTLEDLCFDLPTPNFSIGIAFGINENDQLFAHEVLPGTPAQRAGLKQGDLLLAANGVRFDIADPLKTIRPSIDEGQTLNLRIRRNGKLMTITIEPVPVDS